MDDWRHIDTGPVPGGGKSLALMQKGTEFSIVVDAIELMNSTRGTSEEALAALACAAPIRTRPRGSRASSLSCGGAPSCSTGRWCSPPPPGP